MLTLSSSSAERQLAADAAVWLSVLPPAGLAPESPWQLEAEQCRSMAAAVPRPASPAGPRPSGLLVTGGDVALCALPGVWLQSASFESAELSALPSCSALSSLGHTCAEISYHASELITPSHAKFAPTLKQTWGRRGLPERTKGVHG